MQKKTKKTKKSSWRPGIPNNPHLPAYYAYMHSLDLLELLRSSGYIVSPRLQAIQTLDLMPSCGGVDVSDGHRGLQPARGSIEKAAEVSNLSLVDDQALGIRVDHPVPVQVDLLRSLGLVHGGGHFGGYFHTFPASLSVPTQASLLAERSACCTV